MRLEKIVKEIKGAAIATFMGATISSNKDGKNAR